jgi:hypothetical protein
MSEGFKELNMLPMLKLLGVKAGETGAVANGDTAGNKPCGRAKKTAVLNLPGRRVEIALGGTCKKPRGS